MPSVDNVTSIPAPRVPLVDPATGLISNEWYRFLLNIFTLTGSGTTTISIDDLQVGPPVQESTGNGGSTGNVIGPASSTDNALVRFDGTTGKYIQNGLITEDDTGNLANVNSITDPDYIGFNTGYATALTAGQLGWDGNNTLGLGMAGGNVTQHIGEDQFYYIKASSAITKGQVIMFTGAVGASGVLIGAPATGVTDGSYIMGIAAESIVLNGFGLVQSFGTLRNVDTSAYVDGDILWYDPSVAGGLTKTKPSAPNIKVQMAAVAKGGSVGGGVIFIRVSAGSTLGGTDSNAQFVSPTSGNTIIYDGTAGYWKNADLTAGTGISVTNSAGGITITNTAPSSGGTVTSVTGTSPVASSGGTTPAISLSAAYGDTLNPYASKTANYVLAAPNGSAGTPSFRAIVAADIPTLNQNTTGTASNVTGTVAIANGGTGQTTAVAAFNALSPMTTLGDIVYNDGTNDVRLAGNTTTTKNFLSQTGTGTVSAAPAWSTVTKSDVGLSNVENTALSTWAGSTNITTLGAIGTGTWNATTIGVSKGGTGLTSIAALSIPVANTTNTYTTVTPTSGQSVRVNAGGTAWEAYTPTAGTVTSVTGTSPVASSGGATPAISLSAAYGDTLNPYASKTANYILAAPNGVAGAPTFRAIVAADIPTLNQNTTGSAGSVVNSLTAGTGLSGSSFNGSAAVTWNLANTTVTAASYTYASITVDAQGRLTAASSGTAPVTSVGATSPIASSGGTTPTISISQANSTTNGYLSSTDWNTFNNKQPAGTYVTSVTGTSPITSSGGTTPAIALASGYGDTQNPYASKTANYFLAAPNGVAGAPTFRALVAADVPTLNQNTTGTASNVTGTVAIANGGTGQTAKTAAYNALSPNTTKGDIEVFDGINNVRLPVGTNTYVLTADSTAASGIKWGPPSGASSNITALGMWENANTISSNYSIASGNNAVSAGPVTINTGVTVTVPTGSNWTIV